MGYKLGPIEIFSNDSTRLLDFISDVLELDVHISESKVTIGPQEFIISDRNDKKHHQGQLSFHLEVDSKEIFQEIKQKLNFFLYRKGPEKIEQIISEDSVSGLDLLVLGDSDGNRWNLSYRYDPFKISY